MNFKKILIAILVLLLASIIIYAGILFFYYPRYLKNKTTVKTEKIADGQIRVMSCNVRCLTPFDSGKKKLVLQSGPDY